MPPLWILPVGREIPAALRRGAWLCPLLLLASYVPSAWSQTQARVSWDLAGQKSVTSTSGFVHGVDEVASGLTIGYDGTYSGEFSAFANIQKLKPSASGGAWPVEARPSPDRYIEFAITPKPGGEFSIDSVTLLLAAKGTQNLRASIRLSSDGTWASDMSLKEEIVLSSVEFVRYALPADRTISFAETIFVRVLPWNTTGDNASTSKYVYIRDVTIVGTSTGGIPGSLPILSTTSGSRISVHDAQVGGTVTSDGGGPVTVRGVCWNNIGAPTIADHTALSGSGTGVYSARMTSLSPGSTYSVRAFATNNSGTAYGNEISLTTLTGLTPPALTTKEVFDLRPASAVSGGTITGWGGTDIIERGVCWTTSGTPTVADAHTSEGSSEGSFVSALTDLAPSTSYFVRAYATNSTGTGYGQLVAFSTPVQSPPIRMTVAQDGSGDYSTIQEAFDAVPVNYYGDALVFVKKGVYSEKVTLSDGKRNVTLLGEDRDSTIITNDDYSGKIVDGITIGTSTSFSVAIDADDFTARNITIRNTHHSPSAQAVALRTDGDRLMFVDCNILGYQDTYYARGGSGTGRVYFKNSFIEGSVDFIFGREIVVFDSCRINVNRNRGYLTAASTDAAADFGLTFIDCRITHDSTGFDGQPITQFWLGRPWQASPRTAYIRCDLPSAVVPSGWMAWNVPPASYAEYRNTGEGARPDQRVPWSSQLTAEEASAYTLENIFSRTSYPGFYSDWLPRTVPRVR